METATPPGTASSLGSGSGSGSGSGAGADGKSPSSSASTSTPDEASRLLLRYDVIIIDEAHERTLNTDFLLGSLKRIQAERRDLTRRLRGRGRGEKKGGKQDEDRDGQGSGDEEQTVMTSPATYRGFEMRELKLVVMSATIDAEKFSSFFNRRVRSGCLFALKILETDSDNRKTSLYSLGQRADPLHQRSNVPGRHSPRPS